jgi:probable F420-dependent oxidoreductase
MTQHASAARPPSRPFRFLADARAVVDGRSLAALARRAEAMGFDALVIPDHLGDQLSPVPAMATIAAATDRLRIAAFVLNNDLRHPAVLAQDLASLDILSGGRLIVAIGAGWNEPEYRTIGLPFDPTPVRQARLAEAVAVLKGCLGGQPFSFAGTHYTIDGHDGLPAPVQRPHPPFLIGGGGRRTLELAGREADIVGLAPRILSGSRADPRSLTLAAAEEKLDWVRAAAGERFASLEVNAYPTMGLARITDLARSELTDLAATLEARTGHPISADELLASPHVYLGSVDGLVEKLRGLRERLGISSFMVGEVDDLAPVVERLAGT